MRSAVLLLSLSMLGGVGFTAGCDRTVSEKKETHQTPDGKTVTNESKTVEKSDGTIVKEKSHDVNP